jgi:plastocyanin domain-containing protein
MEQLLIGVGSIAAIGFIVWWFFGKPTEDVVAADSDGSVQTITITVSGGYTPNRIQLQKGVPAKLIFHRTDPSSCLDEVILPDFGVQAKLPVNKAYEIAIQPDTAGSYHYVCGMHMFSGEIIVK